MINLKSNNNVKKIILAISFLTVPGLGFSTEITDSDRYIATNYRDSRVTTFAQQPTTPPEQGAEARYDASTNKLDIPAVDYLGSKYRVILVNQGDFVFTVEDIITLDPLSAPPSNQQTAPTQGEGREAIYNTTTNELDIPSVDSNGSKYRVVLKNTGNLVFTVTKAEPLSAR